MLPCIHSVFCLSHFHVHFYQLNGHCMCVNACVCPINRWGRTSYWQGLGGIWRDTLAQGPDTHHPAGLTSSPSIEPHAIIFLFFLLLIVNFYISYLYFTITVAGFLIYYIVSTFSILLIFEAHFLDYPDSLTFPKGMFKMIVENMFLKRKKNQL